MEKFGKRTDADIKAAVRERCKDSSAAEAKYGHILYWDTSAMTSMNSLFGLTDEEEKAGKFWNQNFNEDLSRWDVRNCTDMSFMFHKASTFTSDVSGWNVGNCTDMSFMFHKASKFNQDSVKSWNLSGKNTTNMFG